MDHAKQPQDVAKMIHFITWIVAWDLHHGKIA
jgi:hypothetical protein